MYDEKDQDARRCQEQHFGREKSRYEGLERGMFLLFVFLVSIRMVNKIEGWWAVGTMVENEAERYHGVRSCRA